MEGREGRQEEGNSERPSFSPRLPFAVPPTEIVTAISSLLCLLPLFGWCLEVYAYLRVLLLTAPLPLKWKGEPFSSL